MAGAPKLPKGTEDIELTPEQFSPVGDETRTVGGEAVAGFIRPGNDIPVEKKHTLAKYLGRVTAGNAFPITSDIYVEESITSPTGAPIALKKNLPDEQRSFTNPNHKINPFTKASDPKNDLDTYSNSGGGVGDQEALEWTQNNLSKGKVDDSRTYDGNSLLRYTIGKPPSLDGKFNVPESPDLVATGFVSKVLSHNRFTSASPSSAQRDELNRLGPSYQTKFGQYDPLAPIVSPGVLDKIGPLLALRATGELNAENAGYDPPDTLNGGTLLPGKAQLGILKIDAIVLEAKSALNDIAAGVKQSGGLESNFNTTAQSFGQINSYADPFSGLFPAGMTALAISLILASTIAIETFTLTVGLLTNASSSPTTARDTQGRYTLGQSFANPTQSKSLLSLPVPSKLFGIQRTNHPYGEAVTRGLEAFFSTAASSFEPGFFVVMLREILASATIFVDKIKGSFRRDFFSIASGAVGFVEAIRTSKLVASMNVFAHLGDQMLTIDELQFDDIARPSTVDDLPSGLPGSAIAKSRDNGSLRLAWRNSTAPMSILLPTTLRNAGASKGLTRRMNKARRTYADMETTYLGEAKIPLATMKALETRLEAEYVPFYFHDMRTNELTAFHAFLTTLTDNFTVNHDTHDAYGRVDQVKIYKNTTRAINLSFMVVATNEDDFDFMWMKINKLITLVYPQWSEGLGKTTPQGNKFVQPFSQVPAASPVVRLRVGDVIKSNYSRFALKRIFGYGSSNFSYTDQGTKKTTDFSSLRADDERSLAAASKQPPGQGFDNSSDSRLLRAAPAGGYPRSGSKLASENLHNIDTRRVKITAVKNDDSIEVTDSTGTSYIVTVADLIELNDNALPASKGASSSDPIDRSFFSPGDNVGSGPSKDTRTNTIVRSFETSMSKGLPGVITSINFNFIEGTTWETEIFGSKAPKVVKIDMGITPFHDIAPGLDAYGANRAPVYNVGQLANIMSDDDAEGEQLFERNKIKMWERK